MTVGPIPCNHPYPHSFDKSHDDIDHVTPMRLIVGPGL